MKLYPMKLIPYVSETVWGGRRLIDEYNVKTDKKNAAEAWVLSCRKTRESRISNGEFAGRPLSELADENPEIRGKNAEKYEEFPVLIKFIDAADDLSVQVHPTREYCKKKGEGQGKTECWYIADRAEDAKLLLGFKEKITAEKFRKSIENGNLTDYAEYVKVEKGDFFFIPAGTMHAICKGILLVEIQENSDTTYRIYDYNRPGIDGKPRELRVSDAVAVTKTEKYSQPEFCKGKSFDVDGRRVLADLPLFKVAKLDVLGESQGEADGKSFVSLVVISGNGFLNWGGGSLSLQKGDSVFIPAGLGKYRLAGSLEIIETTV